MKLGILTDMHLGLVQYGLKEREQDFYDQYMRAVQTFVDADVDVVIIGGDVFDKSRPSPKALKNFLVGLDTLTKNGIKILNVVGNHAMVQSDGFVTADDFIDQFNFDYELLDLDNYYENNGVFISGLPYHYDFELDSLVEKVSKLNRIAKTKNGINVLVLHQSFKEFCGFTGEEFSIEDIDVSNFDLIVCGHIHEKKIYELPGGAVFLQPGSLERSSVAEARDEEINGKGIFIIDTNDVDVISVSNSFYRIKSPRRFFIADMYMNDVSEIDGIRKEIEDEISSCAVPPILFLTVHDTSKSFMSLIDLTKDMNHECLTVKFKYFDESVMVESVLDENGDLPSPRDALKISLNTMDEEEVKLGLSMYDLLKDNKDISRLLQDFFEKREKRRIKNSFDYEKEMKELHELEEYFENL